MLTIQRPKDADAIRCLMQCQQAALTYDCEGVTNLRDVPSGFDVDNHSTILGFGEEVFDAAKQAIKSWAMFPKPLTKLYWPDQAIHIGADVAVLFRTGPLWSLNPCRIIYMVDDSDKRDEKREFGFAYGTLPGHLECGEERFTVTWYDDDNSVRYELVAVSRPDHWLTRVGHLYARTVQAKFRSQSAASMRDFVNEYMLTQRSTTTPPCDSTSLCGGVETGS